ncbi:hypothetical protein G7Z17_g10549 [Cylindrodendrum hubeiense]|uniref:Uncharacterized protein n=1 Tax=Cylindrodendrum hubeiense TaxID=595255 RepID=A0A9P5LC76_9HYPO|nr:hypothetical protein G7Z17_g10549 [Cylindrodendrum hubeiense]
MSTRRPPLSVTGGVKPWVEKFNVASKKDTFLGRFVGSADARIVEITELYDGDDTEYISTSLGSNGVEDWPDLSGLIELPRAGGPRGILRLAILPFNTEDEKGPPFSWKGFQHHLDLLHLPNSFVDDEDMETPPSWFEVAMEGDLKGFILKPERWDSNLANFTLSVAYSPTTRATNVVAHMLHKTDVKHLLTRLQMLRSIAWHPLLVPLILMEKRIEGTAETLASIRDSLYAVERRLGTHKNYHGKRYYEKLQYYAYGEKVWEQRNDKDVAFETAPGNLTSIVSDCAMFEAKCLINEDLLDWLQGLNAALCEPDNNGKLSAVSANSIRMKISAMKMWCGNNRSRSVYLAKRAEAQMQACFNLMGQRDNALNLKTTEATIRDSSDMRAIAWVTLAFLPATFVAV